jgi:hypothetical protein
MIVFYIYKWHRKKTRALRYLVIDARLVRKDPGVGTRRYKMAAENVFFSQPFPMVVRSLSWYTDRF